MRAGQTQPVFPIELAERVLRFCDAPEHKEVCAELSAIIGHDPTAWRPLVADATAPSTAALALPKEAAFRQDNPGFLRQPAGQTPAYESTVSPELKMARGALYDATRLLMRAAPTDGLTQELFIAACEAWLAQVTAEPELSTYAASREVLKDTRTIWSYKQSHGRVNLMGRAQLPPFFDGNTQLVELFVQNPHAGCDLAAFGHLPKLRCLTLYTDPNAPLIDDIARLVPHLTKRTAQDGILVHLTVPGYALPKD